MLRTGVDIIETERIRAAIARHGQRFLARIYTQDELAYCCGRVESLAARFAAKEAIAKALGTGAWRAGVLWTDLEVTSDGAGAPAVRLHGAAAERAQRLGLHEWSISLSHDRERSIAFVVALGITDG